MHTKILIFQGDIAVWKETFSADGESGVELTPARTKYKICVFGSPDYWTIGLSFSEY